MPRTLGYIIVALAAFVGAGALVLPVPEQIEVKTEEPAASPKAPRAPTAAPSPRAADRKDRSPSARSPAAPSQQAPAPLAPFPMQDTTKTRTMVEPKG